MIVTNNRDHYCFRRIYRKNQRKTSRNPWHFFESRVLQIVPGFQAGLGGAQWSCRLYAGDCWLPAGQTAPASGDENSAVSRHKTGGDLENLENLETWTWMTRKKNERTKDRKPYMTFG